MDGGGFLAGSIIGRMLLDKTGWDQSVQEVMGQTKELPKAMSPVTTAIKSIAGQFAVGVIAANLITKAFNSLGSELKSCITGAIAEERAERALAAALEITGRELEGNLTHFMDFAQAQMRLTTFTHEQVEGAQTLLLQLTKLSRDGIDRATKGAMGLATTLGIDLHSATLMVTKAMEGNFMALARVGIRVDENLTLEEKQAVLLQKLDVLYKRSTAETNTFGGAVMQLGNQWKEVKESLGRAVTDNEQVRDAIKSVTAALADLAESGQVKEWASGFVSTIAGVIKIILEWAQAVSYADQIIRGSWLFRDIKSTWAEQSRKAREEAAAFQSTLKVFTPSMEKLQGVMEMGPKYWKEWTESVKATDAMLAANKETIVSWIEKGAAWLGLMDDLSDGTKSLAALLKEFGVKTRTELTKELNDAKMALEKLKASTEKTPGGIKVLEEKIADLKEEFTGAKVETRSLAEQLGLLTKADLEKKFDKMIEAVGRYRKELTKEGAKKLTDDLIKLRAEIDGTTPHIETMAETLDRFFEGVASGMSDADVERINSEFAGMARQAQEDFEQATAGIVKSILEIQIPIEQLMPMIEGLADQMGVSANTVIAAFYNLRVDMLKTIGIVLPYIDTIGAASKSAAEEAEEAWKNMTDQMAKAFGEAFANVVRDGLNFKNLMKDIFQGLINAMATMLGKFVSEAVTDLGNIKKALSDLATSAAEAFAAMGAALAIFIAAFLILPEVIKTVGELFDWLGGKWDDLQATMTEETWDPREEWEKAFYAIEAAIRGVKTSMEDLNDAWSALLSYAKEAGETSSKWLIDLIRQFREAGKYSKELNEYVLSLLDTIPDALSILVAGIDILKGSLFDALGKLKIGKDLIDALDWRKMHIKEVEESLAELGRIAILTFNAMIASGKPWIDVVEAMAAPLAALREKYKELGLSFVGTGLGHLFRIVGITKAHKELFEAIDATRQILVALGDTVWLTADAWKTLTGDIVSQFHALRHGGLSVEDSLRAMVPSLQAIVNYAAAYGFELDAQTQSLVDQAMAHGWIKEAQKTEANILVEGFNRVCDILIKIAEVLGADVSGLMTDISTTAGTFYKTSEKTVTAWKEMDGVLVPFNESLKDANELAKKLGITVSEIGHDMTPFVTATGGGRSGVGVSRYQEGGIAWTRQLAEVGWPEPEVITPLSKYREPGQPVNMTFNIRALDGADVISATRRIIIPELQKFYRHGGQIPARAIGGT